ncbi:MAG: hypothetical protein E7345_05250 [Clostridiales bacterium]|nr:hypothetical protein [Clostridiales bacterium]
MSNNFHKYKFKIKEMSSFEAIKEYHKIKVCCNKSNEEAYLYSTNGSGNYSLYLKDRFFYLSIDNETKNISAFDGDLDIKLLKFVKIQLPSNIINAILSIDTTDKFEQGCGGYINFDISKIYYDKSQKLLQIGNLDPNEITYKIFDNGFAQLQKNNLTGLMFTEIEL